MSKVKEIKNQKMTKIAKTKYDINDLIKKRWSPRAFSSDKISKDEVKKLLEAASWAPSSYNEQPWRFIVGFKDDETYDKIFSCLVQWNQNWAKTASVLMITLGKKYFSKNNKANRFNAYDTGSAMGILTIQAIQSDIYVHQMGGFDDKKVREIFQVPEEYEVLAAVAMGKKGDINLLDEEYHSSEKAERTRKPIEEFVFTKEWGTPI